MNIKLLINEYLLILDGIGIPWYASGSQSQYIALKNKIQMDMKIFFVFNYVFQDLVQH